MEKHHAKRIACQYIRAMEYPRQTFSRSMTKNVSLELMNVDEEIKGILKNRDDPFIRIEFSVHRKERIAYIQEIHGLGFPKELEELFAWLLDVIGTISVQMIIDGPGGLASIDGWFYFDWEDNLSGMSVACELPLIEEFSQSLGLRLSYFYYSRNGKVALIQGPPFNADQLYLLFRTIKCSIAIPAPCDPFHLIQDKVNQLRRHGELCQGEEKFCPECHYAPYCPYNPVHQE